MRRIRIPNPQVLLTYKTYLGADYASGTSATVVNTASFANNDLGLFGEPTEEKTEIKKVSTVTAPTTFTLASALNFPHAKGESIYKILWDFVSIEGRATSSGTFAELSQSGLQYDNKQNETVYYHSSGDDNWQYRFRFYNSSSQTYSEYSPTLSGTGFTQFQAGYMIRNVRKIVQDEDRKIVSDDEILRFLSDAQDIIYAHNPRYWFLFVDTYKANTGIAALDSTGTYSLNGYSNFGHLDCVKYKYVSGATSKIYRLEKKTDVEFEAITSDLNRGEDNWVEDYRLLPADSSSDNGYIEIDPVPVDSGIGTLYPKYYERMAVLDDVADETQVPLPKLLEDYAIGKIYRIKGNETKAELYEKNLISDSNDKVPPGLLMLDKLDAQQKKAVGQPRNLWNFRGRKYPANMYGNTAQNRDFIKENYMD